MKNLVLLFALAPSIAFAQARPATEAETAVIEKAMQSRLKDPESMRMQNIRMTQGKTEGMLTACGDVNAKNGFGGYVGFRTFYAMYINKNNKGEPAAVVIGVDDGRTNAASTMCTREGL